jgi:hypothetical protein
MTTDIPKEIERQIIARLENGDDRDDIILVHRGTHFTFKLQIAEERKF